MRSAAGAEGPGRAGGTNDGAGDGAAGGARRRPPLLTMAVLAQGLEAAGLGVVVVLNIIDSASGRSYRSSNAIALIGVELIVAIGIAAIAAGMARMRPWSRTPAVLTQVIAGFVAVLLLEAHRLGWGVPVLLLMLAGLVGLLAPTSLRALARRD